VPDLTRVIEYQVVAWADLDRMGDLQARLKETLGVTPEVGILRCATKDGSRMTFAGNAAATRELVRSGAAANPDGIAISKVAYPVFLKGWPHR